MSNLTGKLLAAMPGIGDPRFQRSVILICAHSETYTMGLVINNPLDDLRLGELLKQLGIEQDIQRPDSHVMNGGPVGIDRGFVLHSPDYFSDGATIFVSDSLYMTATREILDIIACDGAPSKASMLLGYAGWGPGQLEHELGENAWLVCEANEDIVFSEQHSLKWEQTLERMGVKPAMLHLTGGQA